MANQHLRFLFCLLLVTLISSQVHAQFAGKSYQQWTAKEAEGLLINSPWAQTQAGLMAVGRLYPLTAAANTAITISLRSALPVRQALARLKQLKNKYDKKSNSEKAAIDDGNKSLLECPECADYYIVTMSPGPGSETGLPGSLQKASFARVKLDVEMKNEKGETRELVKFVPPKFTLDNAMFFFSRFNSKGEPLIGSQNHTLTVSFHPGLFGFKPAMLSQFHFDVTKMIVNGQVAF